MSINDRSLRWGSTILAVGAAGIISASIAILSRQPDPGTRTGRHLWAGALALASLSVVEVLIALYPLRRGEKWAFWAAAVPLVVLGIPILILDATHAPRENLFTTLAPQVLGLGVAAIGLTLAARGIFR